MIVLCGPFIKTIFKDFKGEVEFVSTYICDRETSKYRITGTDIEFNVKSTDHPSAHLLSGTNKQFPEKDLPMIKAFNERENDIDDIRIEFYNNMKDEEGRNEFYKLQDKVSDTKGGDSIYYEILGKNKCKMTTDYNAYIISKTIYRKSTNLL
jgi:hypothetical protein